MPEVSSNSTCIERMPDFIIGGAMKCATTTLHGILAAHPSVFIPNGEIKYFDLDDIESHPANFVYSHERWVFPTYHMPGEKVSEWYLSHFSPASPTQLVGEDSPSYLCSSKAPPRIAQALPHVKMIFLLRDPVDRAYSQYWHQVRTGRAFYNFEDTIQYSPGNLIKKGFYLEQLRHFLTYFPSSQIKVVLFERLIKEPNTTVADICDFLGIDAAQIATNLSTHNNRGRTPRRLYPKLITNYVLRYTLGDRHLSRLPGGLELRKPSLLSRMIVRIHRMLNPESTKAPPKMKEETYRFLSMLYRRENRELSNLLQVNLADYWKSMRAT